MSSLMLQKRHRGDGISGHNLPLLNSDILLSIQYPNFIFCMYVDKINLEGILSQNLHLGLTFCFM